MVQCRMNNNILITKAIVDDLQIILDLQKLAYISEANIYEDHTIQPLCQTLEELQNEFETHVFLKASAETNIVGSVRANRIDNTCFIGKLIVNPAFQNQGTGTKLMNEIENCFSDVKRFELFTGKKSSKNIYLYKKLGYEVFEEKQINSKLTLIFMEKNNERS